MIHLSTARNNIAFGGMRETTIQEEPKHVQPSAVSAKIFVPAMIFLAGFNPIPSQSNDNLTSNIHTEIVSSNMHTKNPTELNIEDLENAPSPEIIIAGKKQNAGIVVDVSANRLYRYDSEGDVIDGYKVATGKIGRSGKSITDTGIRKVDHLETYPYENAYGTKRRRNPDPYGPHLLYLTTVDPNTGEILGSNGEFIHGNNDSSSIGEHASGGCIRMDNEVITQLFNEVKPGTLVLIK